MQRLQNLPVLDCSVQIGEFSIGEGINEKHLAIKNGRYATLLWKQLGNMSGGD